MIEMRGYTPIAEKFLENNFLFALSFREGFLFGRTLHRRFTSYKPWNLIDADGTTVDILPATAQAELRFRDPRNNEKDILFLSTSSNANHPWFFHGAFGIKPQHVRMYLRQPEGEIVPGKFPNLNPIRPSQADHLGYIDEINSPYEKPSDYVEVVIPPLMHIAAEYYNRAPAAEKRRHQPVVNIQFCLYWVEFFRAETHPDLISDIAARRREGAKASFLKVGLGDFPHDLGTTLRDDWKVIPMKIDEARALGGRR